MLQLPNQPALRAYLTDAVPVPTKERDKFVAKTIDRTLKKGEMGVLLMGSYHDVISHLPKDIAVQQVKEREKLNAYFEELISGKNEKRFKQLAEYLILPCVY